MTARRGTSNTNSRGSAVARRARRAWLAKKFAHRLGGVLCYHCAAPLAVDAFEVDRYPICGHAGGGYSRDNIVPSCAKCNRERCTVARHCERVIS